MLNVTAAACTHLLITFKETDKQERQKDVVGEQLKVPGRYKYKCDMTLMC